VGEFHPARLAGETSDTVAPTPCTFLLTHIPLRKIILCMARKKNPAAVALGKLGGKARAEKLSDQERSDIAKKAVAARNKKLSATERRRIALLAVQARERKRKRKRKEQ
jgi:hypothetical protein